MNFIQPTQSKEKKDQRVTFTNDFDNYIFNDEEDAYHQPIRKKVLYEEDKLKVINLIREDNNQLAKNNDIEMHKDLGADQRLAETILMKGKKKEDFSSNKNEESLIIRVCTKLSTDKMSEHEIVLQNILDLFRKNAYVDLQTMITINNGYHFAKSSGSITARRLQILEAIGLIKFKQPPCYHREFREFEKSVSEPIFWTGLIDFQTVPSNGELLSECAYVILKEFERTHALKKKKLENIINLKRIKKDKFLPHQSYAVLEVLVSLNLLKIDRGSVDGFSYFSKILGKKEHRIEILLCEEEIEDAMQEEFEAESNLFRKKCVKVKLRQEEVYDELNQVSKKVTVISLPSSLSQNNESEQTLIQSSIHFMQSLFERSPNHKIIHQRFKLNLNDIHHNWYAAFNFSWDVLVSIGLIKSGNKENEYDWSHGISLFKHNEQSENVHLVFRLIQANKLVSMTLLKQMKRISKSTEQHMRMIINVFSCIGFLTYHSTYLRVDTYESSLFDVSEDNIRFEFDMTSGEMKDVKSVKIEKKKRVFSVIYPRTNKKIRETRSQSQNRSRASDPQTKAIYHQTETKKKQARDIRQWFLNPSLGQNLPEPPQNWIDTMIVDFMTFTSDEEESKTKQIEEIKTEDNHLGETHKNRSLPRKKNFRKATPTSVLLYERMMKKFKSSKPFYLTDFYVKDQTSDSTKDIIRILLHVWTSLGVISKMTDVSLKRDFYKWNGVISLYCDEKEKKRKKMIRYIEQITHATYKKCLVTKSFTTQLEFLWEFVSPKWAKRSNEAIVHKIVSAFRKLQLIQYNKKNDEYRVVIPTDGRIDVENIYRIAKKMRDSYENGRVLEESRFL
jgi:hypothetical protein